MNKLNWNITPATMKEASMDSFKWWYNCTCIFICFTCLNHDNTSHSKYYWYLYTYIAASNISEIQASYLLDNGTRSKSYRIHFCILIYLMRFYDVKLQPIKNSCRGWTKQNIIIISHMSIFITNTKSLFYCTLSLNIILLLHWRWLWHEYSESVKVNYTLIVNKLCMCGCMYIHTYV